MTLTRTLEGHRYSLKYVSHYYKSQNNPIELLAVTIISHLCSLALT